MLTVLWMAAFASDLGLLTAMVASQQQRRLHVASAAWQLAIFHGLSALAGFAALAALHRRIVTQKSDFQLTLTASVVAHVVAHVVAQVVAHVVAVLL